MPRKAIRRLIQIVVVPALALVVLAGLMVAFYGLPPALKGDSGTAAEVETLQATSGEQGVIQVDSSQFGGAFELTSANGGTVTEAALESGWSLLYFGYTYCPDACPIDLGVMGQALEMAAKRDLQLDGYFVTIDPARDTRERLRNYLPSFHESITGLTGSDEAIAEAAEAYRVAYNKTAPDGGEVAEDSQNYLMDHSTFLYLVDPDGKVVRLFRHAVDPQVIVNTLAQQQAAS